MNDNDQSANVANGRNRIASWMLRRLIIFSLVAVGGLYMFCLLYTSPSPRDATLSRMPSSA